MLRIFPVYYTWLAARLLMAGVAWPLRHQTPPLTGVEVGALLVFAVNFLYIPDLWALAQQLKAKAIFDEDLAGNRRLAEHRQQCLPAVEHLEQLHQHPFGDIEIALAGQGFQPSVTLEVRLFREVLIGPPACRSLSCGAAAGAGLSARVCEDCRARLYPSS